MLVILPIIASARPTVVVGVSKLCQAVTQIFAIFYPYGVANERAQLLDGTGDAGIG